MNGVAGKLLEGSRSEKIVRVGVGGIHSGEKGNTGKKNWKKMNKTVQAANCYFIFSLMGRQFAVKKEETPRGQEGIRSPRKQCELSAFKRCTITCGVKW